MRRRRELPLCDLVKFSFNEDEGVRKFNSSTIGSSLDTFEAKPRNLNRSIRKRRNIDYNEDFSYNEKDDSDYDDESEEGDIKEATRKRIKNSPLKPANKKLTEYEKMLQKNLEEKMEFLKSLQINETIKGLEKKRKKSVQSQRVYNVKKTFEPVRKSRRLAKLDMDLSEESLFQKALQEAEESSQDTVLPPILPFKDALHCKYERIQTDEKCDFSYILSEPDTKPILNYCSYFAKMSLTNMAKVVDNRISALCVHNNPDKTFVCAGSKTGLLGFYDVSDDNINIYAPHTAGITQLRFDSNDPNILLSSSYDGTLRSTNFETQVFTEVLSNDFSMTYFDFLSYATLLCSFKNGSISIADRRSENKVSEMKHQCHDSSIKSVSVHPVEKHYFLTSGLKGLMCLWDLRKLQHQPVVEVHHHTKSVTSAFFSSLTGNYILTTSLDDSICIFDSSSLGKKLQFKKKMKHNNCTGRWLSAFRASWLPNSDDTFAVGSMGEPRIVEVYNNELNNIHKFQDESLTITSLHAFHPSLPVGVFSNSSGKVFTFAAEV